MIQQLNVKGISDELIHKLDSIVEKSNYSNRSELIIDVLNQYCLCQDRYFIKILPDVTRILCEDAFKNETKNIDEQLELTLAVNKKTSLVVQKLCNILDGNINDV